MEPGRNRSVTTQMLLRGIGQVQPDPAPGHAGLPNPVF
jgi:hypothetical protein